MQINTFTPRQTHTHIIYIIHKQIYEYIFTSMQKKLFWQIWMSMMDDGWVNKWMDGSRWWLGWNEKNVWIRLGDNNDADDGVSDGIDNGHSNHNNATKKLRKGLILDEMIISSGILWPWTLQQSINTYAHALFNTCTCSSLFCRWVSSQLWASR